MSSSSSSSSSSSLLSAMKDDRFCGKNIMITGAGGSFGREGCIYFGLRGAYIAALDRDIHSLEETIRIVQEEIEKAYNNDNDSDSLRKGKIYPFVCDVTNISSVTTTVNEAISVLGGGGGGCIDLLWNNAGYQGQIKPTLEYDPIDFATVMNINVTGMFVVMQAVAKKMAAAAAEAADGDDDEGKRFRYAIVNTASVAGLRGTPAMIAYASSKAAVISMTICAAKDLAPHGIRVNAISPALIGPGPMWTRQNELHAQSNSPYFSSDPDTVAKSKIGSVPMKRLGTVKEVIQSVAYLLSDDSSYTTAFNLVVDGGLSGGMH